MLFTISPYYGNLNYKFLNSNPEAQGGEPGNARQSQFAPTSPRVEDRLKRQEAERLVFSLDFWISAADTFNIPNPPVPVRLLIAKKNRKAQHINNHKSQMSHC